MTDFMKSRGMEEDMAEDRHLWRLGVDGRLYIIIIIILVIKYIEKFGLYNCLILADQILVNLQLSRR